MSRREQRLLWRVGAGVLGGLVGSQLPIPLGTLLGAGLATATVNLQAGQTVGAPVWLRVLVQLLLGGLVGSAFGPVLLQPALLPLALGVTLVPVAIWVAGSLLVARTTAVDLATALLVSAPGSPAETTAVAAEAGIQVPLVAAVQLGRVLAVLTVAGLLARCL
jgi:uncharacterized protein